MKKRRGQTDAPPIGDRLLTLREAADVLRLSTRTLREYLQRGEIEGRSGVTTKSACFQPEAIAAMDHQPRPPTHSQRQPFQMAFIEPGAFKGSANRMDA